MHRISHWTVFTDKSYAITRGKLTASISTNKTLYLNREAWISLGRPAAAELLFDEFNKWIGIRRADPNLPYSRRVRQHARDKGFCITLAGFMTRFGIRISQTVRFPHAFVNTDGILVLDLKRTVVTSRTEPRRPTTF